MWTLALPPSRGAKVTTRSYATSPNPSWPSFRVNTPTIHKPRPTYQQCCVLCWNPAPITSCRAPGHGRGPGESVWTGRERPRQLTDHGARPGGRPLYQAAQSPQSENKKPSFFSFVFFLFLTKDGCHVTEPWKQNKWQMNYSLMYIRICTYMHKSKNYICIYNFVFAFFVCFFAFARRHSSLCRRPSRAWWWCLKKWTVFTTASWIIRCRLTGPTLRTPPWRRWAPGWRTCSLGHPSFRSELLHSHSLKHLIALAEKPIVMDSLWNKEEELIFDWPKPAVPPHRSFFLIGWGLLCFAALAVNYCAKVVQ